MYRFFLLFIIPLALCAEVYNFSFHKKGTGIDGNNTMLIIGGIQGDEPGGFNAASLLVTHYTIKEGNVWIVPNLNFKSIIERSRGVYGDMNRKFAQLPENDPEFPIVEKIKEIIKAPEVDLILNLHDGSGFYRDTYEDKWHNPWRWGQSTIIDQTRLPNQTWGDLANLGAYAVAHVNQYLIDPSHRFSLKNTETAQGDKEMEKTLTYFAIRHGKPAFGIEGSKNFLTYKRAYYHLLAIEAFMHRVGITFERDFDLTPQGVRRAINDQIDVVFYDERFRLPVQNSRDYLNYYPLKKGEAIHYRSNNPLVAIVEHGKHELKVCYGNRRMMRIRPQYFEFDDSLDIVDFTIDGERVPVRIGDTVNVKENFSVLAQEGYRVNVIGYVQKGTRNESGITIPKNAILKRYSVDRAGKIYRVELYKEKKFSGMILVNFDKTHKPLEMNFATTPLYKKQASSM